MKTYLPISICMAYYNRKELLKNTFLSIFSKSVLPEEIVVVDDASGTPLIYEDVADIVKDYKTNIVIHNFRKEEKTWINPVVAFNKAVSLSSKDIIILQNPECFHKSNIVSKCLTMQLNTYTSMSCYSLSEVENPFDEIIYNNKCASFDGESAWYNHSIYRPKHFHFCAMMYKDDFYKAGGFNDAFRNGIGYDDDAFIFSLRQNKIELNIDDSEIVLHQFHTVSHSQNLEKIEKNRNIYYGMLEEKCII